MKNKKKDIQEQAIWVLNPLLNKSAIRAEFDKEMQNFTPQFKNFGFWHKISQNSKRLFSQKEIEVLNIVKNTVQLSIEFGILDFIIKKQYIKSYVIPNLEKVNKFGSEKEISTNVNTVTTLFNRKNKSNAMAKAIQLSKTQLIKIKL